MLLFSYAVKTPLVCLDPFLISLSSKLFGRILVSSQADLFVRVREWHLFLRSACHDKGRRYCTETKNHQPPHKNVFVVGNKNIMRKFHATSELYLFCSTQKRHLEITQRGQIITQPRITSQLTTPFLL